MGFENYSQKSCQPMRALQDPGTSQKIVGIPTGFLSPKLYHIMLYLAWVGLELTTLVVIGTDDIGTVVVYPITIRSRPRRHPS
jgi:hypothetical protein